MLICIIIMDCSNEECIEEWQILSGVYFNFNIPYSHFDFNDAIHCQQTNCHNFMFYSKDDYSCFSCESYACWDCVQKSPYESKDGEFVCLICLQS